MNHNPTEPKLDVEKLTALLWDALKRRCCVNPQTAVRIVMLNQTDVEHAMGEAVRQFERMN